MSMKDAIFGTAAPSSHGGATYRDSIQAWLPVKNIIGGVVITDDDVFAEAFLKQGLVAVVPCSGFGIRNFVRWTYATSMDNIKEGLDRLEKFLAE